MALLRMNRRPPRSPNWKIEKGYCVWCGEKVEGRRRSWCSDKCVDEYRIANFAGDAWQAVWKRDKGKCASCGLTPDERPGHWIRGRQRTRWYSDSYHWTEIEWSGRRWEADHIFPLWKVDRTVPDAFWFWTLANLQTLCEPCHKAKTKTEAAERAALKRPQGNLL